MRKRTSESLRISRNADWGKKEAHPLPHVSSSSISTFFLLRTDLLTLLEAQRIDGSLFCSLKEKRIVPCYDA